MKDLSIKKLYYSISEVSKIAEIEQYVLRYWETEFEQLTPQKNRAGNRIYTNKDIQVILQIKSLLRDKKYTIEGAKKILASYTPDKVPGNDANEPTLFDTSSSTVANKKPTSSLNNSREEIKSILE